MDGWGGGMLVMKSRYVVMMGGGAGAEWVFAFATYN